MQDVHMQAVVDMQVEAMLAVVTVAEAMVVAMRALDTVVILAAVVFITMEVFTIAYIIHALVLV